MTTRTLTEILTHYASVITSLTPSVTTTPSSTFRENEETARPLRKRFNDADLSDILRRFEVKEDGERQDLGTMSTSSARVLRPVAITVAYPAVPKLYGLSGRRALEALIESDATQIRNAIFDVGGLVGSGHQANFITQLGVDQADERLWFQDFAVDAQFFMAQ